MDMFDVKRRDFPKTEKFTDLNQPPFGGPNENVKFEGNKRKSLNKYQRVIERDHKTEGGLHNPATGEKMFQPNYDSAWNAVTQDRASRDANKKPTEIMKAKPTIFTSKVDEQKKDGQIMRFDQFVNENFGNPEMEEETQPEYMQTEEENPLDDINNTEEPLDNGYEVDEEQLEQLMEEYGDDLGELIDKIVEGMEIEKEEASDLLCAAIEKICKTPDEETDDSLEMSTDDSEADSNLDA